MRKLVIAMPIAAVRGDVIALHEVGDLEPVGTGPFGIGRGVAYDQ